MSFSLPSSPKIKSKFSRSSGSVPSPAPALLSTPLPASHPLIAELTSLRQQLSQYQKAAHQASIQLQGIRLELALSREKEDKAHREKEGLKREVEVLRSNPLPPAPAPSSNSLTELSLAHRRLSSKLDLTESELSSIHLELAKSQQEIQRLNKEREGDRAIINELRRIEDDREEELEWERGERKRIEEQKKLCDLALAEYSTLVQSLNPTAIPPPTPSKSVSSIFHTPALQRLSLDGQPSNAHTEHDISSLTSTVVTTPLPLTSDNVSPLSPGEVISNLLIGQKGVQQLFQDFTSFLVSKDKHIHSIESKLEELEHSFLVSQDQLKVETSLRVEAELERDRALRDDESASKVVERYMTFTQKTHQTLHMHLKNLRTRSQATMTSLREESTNLKKEITMENEKSLKMKSALDEINEGLARESAGRRRETALRLKMLSNEEKKERKIENWLNKVRITREGVEGAVVEADILESLLDEGVEAVSSEGSEGDLSKDKTRSWRGFNIMTKKSRGNSKLSENVSERNFEEESLARILLAEELVTTLVADLQSESERRMELERQRVEWLAKEAVEGVKVHQEDQEADAHVVFDLEDHDHEYRQDRNGKDRLIPLMNTEDEGTKPTDPVSTSYESIQSPSSELPLTPTSPELESSPLGWQLQELFSPLTARYTPLQKTLHDLTHSLTVLRSTLPTLGSPIPISPKSSKKSHYINLSRISPFPSSDPTLLAILDGLHEVIEDARVDVEIALADHERVYRGFEALLNVGKGKKENTMDEVREYVDAKNDENDDGWNRLRLRVERIENDLAEIKRVIHEMEGMEVTHWDQTHLESEDRKSKKIIWEGINLQTVSIPSHTRSSILNLSPVNSPLNSPSIDGLPSSASIHGNGNGFDPIRKTSNMFSSVGNVGRSFSSSVIGAPRRVSGLATGLYRPGNKKHEGDQGLVNHAVDEDDDVE
ncbi:uncharacterized protein IL334_007542 [Kwoniella shivajii]|uniref:Up-regulated during septation protein 1 domain-containing protein n=1 Tax=Kwoniella shivajii TaxID=564305 RepID=A0ABZ1DAT2_9TREE|nr:hypothetical protein IL334_007542 [Kwoniella shivajii]